MRLQFYKNLEHVWSNLYKLMCDQSPQEMYTESITERKQKTKLKIKQWEDRGER